MKITDNTSIRIYRNKIKNRIASKIKTGYFLELSTPETMKLLGSTENKVTKDKNNQNLPHFEIIKLVLVHCNIVDSNFQQNLRFLYKFIRNKSFGTLFEISPTNHIFKKIFKLEFQTIRVWFTDQNSLPLEIEVKIDLILVIK